MKRNNYKGRKRPNQSSTKEEDSKVVSKSKRKECANDPAWYTVAGQLTKDVASINFNNPAGIVYNLDVRSQKGEFAPSGIMDIFVAPVPGYSEGLSSPINIAAKNIYSWVRHANSGHANYDSPDLMLMIIAMANAYGFYSWMTRLYGMVQVYVQQNRYWGANLVEASGVDASNIISNLANFRYYINQYALKLSALSVPSTMSLFRRYMWMFANVYADEDDPKAQLYMYQPAYFYKYDENNGAGRLVPEPLLVGPNGNMIRHQTLGAIQTYGDNLLAALIGSEDINIMSGDILKAYGPENIWKLQLIDESYAIAPVFSEEVLEQIHNTTFAGKKPNKDFNTPSVGWDTFMVTQDPSIGNGCLICKPSVIEGGNLVSAKFLDFWKTNVTPEDVIVATRNMMHGTRWSQGCTAITAFGTEIPMYALVWNMKSDGTLDPWHFYDDDSRTFINNKFSHAGDLLAYYSLLTNFNEHPLFYLVDYTSAVPYAEVDAMATFGELSNFTVVEFHDLEKMHLSAILSEFAVPFIGNLAK